MMSADVFALIEDMGELPSLPRTLLTIQNVASDERSSADDLARCILEDQALTMRVLKVVNSAFYQRRSREQIRSVHRAVIVMGFETNETDYTIQEINLYEADATNFMPGQFDFPKI